MFAGLIRFLITAAVLPACAYYLDSITMVTWQNTVLAGVILAAIYTVTRPLVHKLLAVINYFLLFLLYVAVDSWLIWTAVSIIPYSVTFAGMVWIVVPALIINVLRFLMDAMSGDLRY